jgi:hypothetical protein
MNAKVLLAQVERWCKAQTKVKARVVRGTPMSDAQIDRIPKLPSTFWGETPTAYDPKRFVVPVGYRSLLKQAGGVRVEYDAGDGWETYEALQLWKPGSCAKAHLGDAGPTLCDSWSLVGTTVDDRQIDTTELLSFATMGYSVEASRWCFFVPATGPIKPPTIFEESNDYECLTGRFADTGEWLSDLDQPAFPSFETWFEAVVAAITAKPLDPEDDDVVRRIYKLAPKPNAELLPDLPALGFAQPVCCFRIELRAPLRDTAQRAIDITPVPRGTGGLEIHSSRRFAQHDNLLRARLARVAHRF